MIRLDTALESESTLCVVPPYPVAAQNRRYSVGEYATSPSIIAITTRHGITMLELRRCGAARLVRNLSSSSPYWFAGVRAVRASRRHAIDSGREGGAASLRARLPSFTLLFKSSLELSVRGCSSERPNEQDEPPTRQARTHAVDLGQRRHRANHEFIWVGLTIQKG